MHRTLLTVAASTLALAAHANGERFEIDASHTYPNFAISHIGYSTMYGRFNETTGQMTMDKEAGQLEIALTIDASSIDTGHDKRDDHLRSPDFFNVAEFPQITFASTGSNWENGQPVSVDGTVTLRGVSKPVTLSVEAFKCGEDPWKNYRCGADATLALKRSDFGMKYGLPGVGDDVRMMFAIEAVRK